jgi:hypothetical protein
MIMLANDGLKILLCPVLHLSACETADAFLRLACESNNIVGEKKEEKCLVFFGWCQLLVW